MQGSGSSPISATPSTMKAAVYKRYGDPEVIHISEIEVPTPKDEEILVKVHTSTVNRTDCGFRSAKYFITRLFSGLLKPRFPILGTEFAGEVQAIGGSVRSFDIGDPVFGFNEAKFGAHAQYLTIEEKGPVATIPESLSYEEAAPICEGAHYALNNIRAARVDRGDRVLINGATGAIGSAAVQLLKHMGAKITAVCGTEHTELVRSLGAERIIDYQKEERWASKEPFDLVFDAVGKSSFSSCKPLLQNRGVYISTELGAGAQNPFLALVTPLFGNKKVLFPIPRIEQKDVLFLKRSVANGDFRPLIDRSYPLERIVDAYHYVEAEKKIGNVLIQVPSKAR